MNYCEGRNRKYANLNRDILLLKYECMESIIVVAIMNSSAGIILGEATS